MHVCNTKCFTEKQRINDLIYNKARINKIIKIFFSSSAGLGHKGQCWGHPHNACGQQERWDPAGGGDQGRGSPGQPVEVRLHGDVSQDQPQRHRALSGAPQPGQEEEHEPQHWRQALGEAVPRRETEGQMQRDVNPGEEENRGGGERGWRKYSEKEEKKEDEREERLTKRINQS